MPLGMCVRTFSGNRVSPQSIEGEFSSILVSRLRFLRSLDHLIRSFQHLLRNRHADLLGGLEIDDKLKFRRLLHWQIGGVGSLQDLVHVSGCAPVPGGYLIILSARASTLGGIFRF